MTTINIGGDAAKAPTIPVKLVGVKYEVTPPKQSFNLRLAKLAPRLTSLGELSEKLSDNPTEEEVANFLAPLEELEKMVSDWVDAAFSKTDAKKVKARLDDSKDRLDTQHIMELVHAVSEAVSKESGEERPTT